MDKKRERKFKGIWIPREIWLNEQMSLIEKALLVEIDSLDNEYGCTAGNDYFAKFFQMGPRQIKRYITRLKEQGWITVELVGRRNRIARVTEQYETLRDINDPQPSEPVRDENVPREGQKRPSSEGHKRPSISISSNNTDNSNKKSTNTAEEFFEKIEMQQAVVNWLISKGVSQAAAELELKKFLDYWTEPNKSKTKVRWQGEKYFDIKRRLATWFRNANKFSGKVGTNKKVIGLAL